MSKNVRYSAKVYTLGEFYNLCIDKEISDYEGFGFYGHNKKIFSDHQVFARDFKNQNSIKRSFKNVVWFER